MARIWPCSVAVAHRTPWHIGIALGSAASCYLAPLSCTAAEPERARAHRHVRAHVLRSRAPCCRGVRGGAQAQALARHVSDATAFMACDMLMLI